MLVRYYNSKGGEDNPRSEHPVYQTVKMGIGEKSQDDDGVEIVRFHNALTGDSRATMPEENVDDATENGNTPGWKP